MKSTIEKIQLKQLKALVNKLSIENIDETLPLIEDHISLLKACHKTKYIDIQNPIQASVNHSELSPARGRKPLPAFTDMNIVVFGDKSEIPYGKEIERAVINRNGSIMFYKGDETSTDLRSIIQTADAVVYYHQCISLDTVHSIEIFCKELRIPYTSTKSMVNRVFVERIRKLIHSKQT